MAKGTSKHVQESMGNKGFAAFMSDIPTGGNKAAAAEYVDWGEVDGRLIAGAVCAVNRMGGSILFGHTRDNSSYSIMLFNDKGKKPLYYPCTPAGFEALEQMLAYLIALEENESQMP